MRMKLLSLGQRCRRAPSVLGLELCKTGSWILGVGCNSGRTMDVAFTKANRYLTSWACRTIHSPYRGRL